MNLQWYGGGFGLGLWVSGLPYRLHSEELENVSAGQQSSSQRRFPVGFRGTMAINFFF